MLVHIYIAITLTALLFSINLTVDPGLTAAISIAGLAAGRQQSNQDLFLLVVKGQVPCCCKSHEENVNKNEQDFNCN